MHIKLVIIQCGAMSIFVECKEHLNNSCLRHQEIENIKCIFQKDLL